MARRAKPKAKKKTARKSTTRKPARRASSPRAKKSETPGGSDVEKRWREYWRCRKDLEQAVDAVRKAQDGLRTAVEIEQARRSEFEDQKGALTELLEVAPPTSERSSIGAAIPKLVDLDDESSSG